MKKKDSTTLSLFEKAEIRSAYAATADSWSPRQVAVALVAARFNVDDSTVRLLVLPGLQKELPTV